MDPIGGMRQGTNVCDLMETLQETYRELLSTNTYGRFDDAIVPVQQRRRIANYTALLTEFRTELNAPGGSKHCMLTAAVPAGTERHRQDPAAPDRAGPRLRGCHGVRHARRLRDRGSDEFSSPPAGLSQQPGQWQWLLCDS